MVARVAVAQGAGAGGVGRQHAADGALSPLAGSGAKRRPDRGQPRVQVAVDDAGLHAHRVGADVEDGAEMPAEIDDQPGAERLAGDAGAGAARRSAAT